MNATLYSTPAAARFAAVFAAAVVTLATLSGIDTLATTEGPAQMAQAAAAPQA